MSKTTTAVSKPMSEEVAAQLRDSYPSEPSALRIQLPRLGMYSQDVTEETKNPKTGKKEINIISEAGTFFIERQTEELDEEGKKKWEKTELGTSIEAIILYQRKQLRHYDGANEVYTSSPIYDTEDEIIPLWRNKSEVTRGLPADLKKMPEFQGVTAAGKPTSKLEDNRILYVKYEGEVYQMTLRGSSMFSFFAYSRKTVPNQVVTSFGSEPKEKGDISWNQMVFESVRPLDGTEAEEVLTHVQDIQKAISVEKASYAAANASKEVGDKELDKTAADLSAAGAAADKKGKALPPGKKKGF